MGRDISKELLEAVRKAATPLRGSPQDYDPLLELIGDARVVLIGEASHGTHEFYRERAEITKRLIREKGFKAVAVEADWPDAYRVNCYVRGGGEAGSSVESLSGFQRFPQWMWRNTVVVDFIGWLRDYNDSLSELREKVGFYGLDLYSLYSSIEEVIKYLEKVDPEEAASARNRYACFEHYGDDPQTYGYVASSGMAKPCNREALAQLIELQQKARDYTGLDGRVAEDEQFYAEQNARLAKNAEEYYRSMFGSRVSSWNLRDCHMAETLDKLVEHLSRKGQQARIVVWEHNSHLGDASATELGQGGELNVGQLVRERYGDKACLIGFSTYEGTVTAASDWGEPAERKRVRPGLPDSYEALFHETGLGNFMLNLREESPAKAYLAKPRLERAIGVIYRPETERYSHYFYARLPEQFDAILHLDKTRALEPLERTAGWETGEVPETFPSSL